MVENNPGKPLRPRQRVLARRRALIADGILPQGGILPCEYQLGRQLDATRATVHLALKQLEVEGLIRTITGGGWSPVASQKPIAVIFQSSRVETKDPNVGGSRYVPPSRFRRRYE